MATTVERPSARSTARTARRPRQNFETWQWFFMRISGLVLVFLALGHFTLTHIVNDVVDTDSGFVADRWSNPLWRAYDWALLALALFHGLNGLRECRTFARVRPSAVEERTLPCCADPTFSTDRLVDQPQNRHTILDQGNKRPEDRTAAHETARAVNGVEYPHPRSAFARAAIFFADDPLIGSFHVEDRPDRGLGSPVSQSHGRGISFHFQPECRPEIGPDRRPCRIGKAARQGKISRQFLPA